MSKLLNTKTLSCLGVVSVVLVLIFLHSTRNKDEIQVLVSEEEADRNFVTEDPLPPIYIRYQSPVPRWHRTEPGDQHQDECKVEISKLNGRHRQMVAIGDSMLAGVVDLYGAGDMEIESYPGARIGQLTRIITSKGSEEGVKAVYIHIGTNDLSYGVERDELELLFRKLLVVAKRVYVGAHLVIGGLVDRRDPKGKSIDEVNKVIGKVCKKEGVGFVEVRAWVNEKHLSSDGLHLNGEGRCRFGRFIEKVLREKAGGKNDKK